MPPITLGPRHSIGFSGSIGRPLRPLPTTERDRPSRRYIPKASPLSLFGIHRTKVGNQLSLKMTNATRYGKIWKRPKTVVTTKGRNTWAISRRPILYTKSLARNDSCCAYHGSIEQKIHYRRLPHPFLDECSELLKGTEHCSQHQTRMGIQYAVHAVEERL